MDFLNQNLFSDLLSLWLCGVLCLVQKPIEFVFTGGGGDWQMVWVAGKRKIEKKIEKEERLKIEKE